MRRRLQVQLRAEQQLVRAAIPGQKIAAEPEQGQQDHAAGAGHGKSVEAAAGGHGLNPERHSGQQEGQSRAPGIHGDQPGDDAF